MYQHTSLIVSVLISYIVCQTVRRKLNTLPSFEQGSTFPDVYTGYLPIISTNISANMFYMFAPHPDNTKPLVLFLNGGPGCSSMVGAFFELGPFSYEDTTLKLNPDSWSAAANLLFIDNPIGAGYSYTDDQNKTPTITALQSAKDVYAALLVFLEAFPEYATNPFYMFGESYGGKYMIALATEIFKNGNKIPLQGFAIGNGWVNPDIQQRAYSTHGYGFGLYDYSSQVSINSVYEDCHNLIAAGKYYEADAKACTPMWNAEVSDGGSFNSYDFRLSGRYEGLESLKAYLLREDVRIALGAKVPYQQCSDALWQKFLYEFQKDYTNMLPFILENTSYRVLVYNGQFDLRCGAMGTSEWMRLMLWSGRAGFNYADQQVFVDSQNKTVGVFKGYKNLTQLIVYNSGHMVPHDQGPASLEMLRRFINVNNNKGSLCRPSDTKCLSYQVKCPYQCGKHGDCSSEGKCICNTGFSGEDCSVAKHDVYFGTKLDYSGYLFGRGMHIYQLFLGDNGVGKVDVQITLKKLEKQGKLHLYMNAAKQFLTPDSSDIEAMRKQFGFNNLEDVDVKVLAVNEIQRENSSHITLVVYNTVDSESSYTLYISSDVSGAKLLGTTLVSILMMSFTGIVMILLFVYGIFQYVRDQKFTTRKYEVIAHEMNEN